MKPMVFGVRFAMLVVFVGSGVQPVVGDEADTCTSGSHSSCDGSAGEAPAIVKIVSSPPSHLDYPPKNLLVDGGKPWISALGGVRDQVLDLELTMEPGQTLARVLWKVTPGDVRAPAHVVLEAKMGEEWRFIARFDSNMTGGWQEHRLRTRTDSKMWRITFVRNHGSHYQMAVQAVRFMVDRNKGVLLQQFTRRIWEERAYTDVKVLSGNSSFPAHRAVLAAASPVLAAMLAEAQQKQRQEIQVDDVGEQSVLNWLEYLYTFDIAGSTDFAVVMMGHKYKVLGLVEKALPVALANLVPGGAIRAVRLLREYSDDPQVKPAWEALQKKVRENKDLFDQMLRNV